MLSLPPSVRIFVARGATDMRKSFDTLASLVCEVIDEDPQSGVSVTLTPPCSRARMGDDLSHGSSRADAALACAS